MSDTPPANVAGSTGPSSVGELAVVQCGAGGSRLAPFRRVEKRPSAAGLTITASVGVSRAPVSRLFNGGGSPIAVRVLMTDADRYGCGVVLQLSRVTRLKGRGDTTRTLRTERHPDFKPLTPDASHSVVFVASTPPRH